MVWMAGEAVCSKCGGTGFVIVERAHVSGAQPCDCRFEGMATRRQSDAQIPPLYRNSSFENFTLSVDNPQRDLRTAMMKAKFFADHFPHDKKPPGLLLIGEPGTGKTHLAVAA
ncbi:MAG: AAA family ATPase, partial [Acidobacteriia bacterium]|nr:AAA family ATPase [Terriglobia bacterium]